MKEAPACPRTLDHGTSEPNEGRGGNCQGKVPAASRKKGSILFLIQQINHITLLLMGIFVGVAYVASTA